MPVGTQAKPPYFDEEPFRKKCEHCGEEVRVWESEVRDSFTNTILLIEARCITGCGRVYKSSVTITEHEKESLQANFGFSAYEPWKNEEERRKLYNAEQNEYIREEVLQE